MQELPEYNDRIVAFIDILGFENIVKSLADNKYLFSSLDYALNRIKWIETSNNAQDSTASNLEVSVFSDSIAITTTKENLYSLICAVGLLQAHLMHVGIFVRGGIAIGPTIHNNGILYGEGMLSAYNLESKSAIYPRIILSQNLVKKIDANIASLIELDFDYFHFVNSFKFEAIGSNADDLAADGHNPRSIYLQTIGNKIYQNILTNHNENHLAKYKWLGQKFNNTIVEYNKINDHKVDLVDLRQN